MCTDWVIAGTLLFECEKKEIGPKTKAKQSGTERSETNEHDDIGVMQGRKEGHLGLNSSIWLSSMFCLRNHFTTLEALPSALVDNSIQSNANLSQARALQGCLFLVPWHFNKIFYFYILCNGRAGGMKTA